MLGAFNRQPKNPEEFVGKLHPALQQHKISVNGASDQDSQTLKKIGTDIERHLNDAIEIKDRLAHVEALRECLKAIKLQSAEVADQMQKCAMKTGAASSSFVDLAILLEGDNATKLGHNRRSLIKSLEDELSSQEQSPEDRKVTLHLLKVVAQMHQHFGKSLGAFQSQGYDQTLVNKTNELVKGLIRDTRHICNDQQVQTMAASESVQRLSSSLAYDDKAAEAHDAALMREMDGTQVIGDKVKNVFGSMLPVNKRISVGGGRAKSTIDSIVQAEDDSERVAHTTQESFRLLQQVETALSDSEVPLLLIDHLREIKRFFTLGVDLLNDICPDEDLDTIRKTLKKRRSVHAVNDAAELKSKSSKESMRPSPIQVKKQMSDDQYKVAELKFAPLPPPLPLKPQSLKTSPGVTLPPPPISRPPSLQKGRPLSMAMSETPKFQAPSPPASPKMSKNYRPELVNVDGLSLGQSALVRLFQSSDLEVASFLYDGSLTPNTIKHINTIVKSMEETQLLGAFLIDLLQCNNFAMFKNYKMSLQNGSSVDDIFKKVPQLSVHSAQSKALESLMVKQILATQCKHFLSKVIGSIHSSVNNQVISEGDFGQLVTKSYKIIFCSRGLLPKILKKAVLDYTQAYTGKLAASKDSICVEHMPVIVLLFYQLILPAMIAPEQFGIQGMPWDQLQTASAVLSSHRDSLRLASPVPPRSPIASVNVSEGQHMRVKDTMCQVASVISELLKAQMNINDDGHGSADDIQVQLMALSLHKDFEVQLEDFVGHLTSARADPFMSPAGPGTGFSQLNLLSQELDLLQEDQLYGANWIKQLQDLTVKYDKIGQEVKFSSAKILLQDAQKQLVADSPIEESLGRPLSVASTPPPLSPHSRQKALSVVKTKFMKQVERWGQVKQTQALDVDSDSD